MVGEKNPVKIWIVAINSVGGQFINSLWMDRQVAEDRIQHLADVDVSATLLGGDLILPSAFHPMPGEVAAG